MKKQKPLAVIGADQLTSTLFKTGDELIGFEYRFNVTRLNLTNGRVSHWFRLGDLPSFLKLIQVLATELSLDGCMDSATRHELRELAESLDQALRPIRASQQKAGL